MCYKKKKQITYVTTDIRYICTHGGIIFLFNKVAQGQNTMSAPSMSLWKLQPLVSGPTCISPCAGLWSMADKLTDGIVLMPTAFWCTEEIENKA